MKFSIFCPNCHSSIGKAHFSNLGTSRDFFCNHCNLAFSLDPQVFGNSKSKARSGLVFNLHIGPDYELRHWDHGGGMDLSLGCVFCEADVEIEKIAADDSAVCDRCGALYYLSFEFTPSA